MITINCVRSLILFMLLETVLGDAECDNLGIHLYEELGCTPIKEKATDKCPSSYDCPSFDRPPDRCYLKGKSYLPRETIPDQGCNVGCFCNTGYDGNRAQFICAAVDCPYFGTSPNETDCRMTYETDSCCSSGKICPPFDNVTKCNIDSETYYEGQKIYPKDSCYICFCRQGFSGKIEAPFCQRLFCGIELRNSNELEQYCAPAYLPEVGTPCCPYEWICHTGKEEIVLPSNPVDSTDKVCKFGPKKLKVGERFTVPKETSVSDIVECECKIPPLVTCIMKGK